MLAPHLRGVEPYQRATAQPGRPDPLKARIRLDANECAFPLPESAKQQLEQALSSLDLARYPDSSCGPLAALLAERHGGHPEDYVFGAGSDEVIALLMKCFSKPRPGAARGRVLFVTPSFSMYRLSTLANNLEPVAVPLSDRFQLDVPAMVEAIQQQQPNLLFLASPNNPTGASFHEADLRTVAEHSGESLLVLDAAYEAFAENNLDALANDFPHVAVLGTVSKVGFAGLRLGWCRLPAGIAAEFHRVRQPFNVSAVSQRLAQLVLTDLQELVADRVKWVRQERARVGKRLEGLAGCFPYPSDANFVLFRVAGDAAALHGFLLDEGIAIKNLDPEGGVLSKHLRVTLGTSEENEAFLVALERGLTAL